MRPYTDPEIRFFELFEPVTESGCWIWVGGVKSWHRREHYGFIYVRPRNVLAHRWAFEKFVRPLNDGEIVCHKCDISLCVNPDHLFVGTQADNMEDMVRKRRSPFGVRNCNAKLDDEAIRFIRSSKLTGAALARKYGVSETTINQARRMETWRHVE